MRSCIDPYTPLWSSQRIYRPGEIINDDQTQSSVGPLSTKGHRSWQVENSAD